MEPRANLSRGPLFRTWYGETRSPLYTENTAAPCCPLWGAPAPCCPHWGKYPRSGGKGFAERYNMSEPPHRLRRSSPKGGAKAPRCPLRGKWPVGPKGVYIKKDPPYGRGGNGQRGERVRTHPRGQRGFPDPESRRTEEKSSPTFEMWEQRFFPSPWSFRGSPTAMAF